VRHTRRSVRSWSHSTTCYHFEVRTGLVLLIALVARAAAAEVPPETRQLVVARAASWNAKEGTLRRYTRAAADAPWQPVGEEIRVSFGHKGLAWGRGLAPTDTRRQPAKGPAKREGDGRTPAGIFRLTEATGAKAAPPPGTRLPYRAAADLVCVDDSASRSYNRIVPPTDPDWQSFESMAMPVIYDLTVFVDHNPRAVAKGGSCIFLHVWRAPGATTLGCTAMDGGALASILAWLDPAAAPAFVALPQPAYDALRAPWKLP
jgi:hypothetical protein